MEHLKKLRCQQGQIDGEKEIAIPIGGLEGGKDSAERALLGNAIEKLITSDNADGRRNRRK